MSYPPQEIIDQMSEGRDFEWDVIETIEEKNKITKILRCGCEFSNGTKTFSYSNKFCDEHAPKHYYDRLMEQKVENGRGMYSWDGPVGCDENDL